MELLSRDSHEGHILQLINRYTFRTTSDFRRIALATELSEICNRKAESTDRNPMLHLLRVSIRKKCVIYAVIRGRRPYVITDDAGWGFFNLIVFTLS